MAKPIKKVWTPERVETTIGSGTYIIEPQPIAQVMEFDAVARQLFDGLGELSTKYWIEDGEEKLGPYESEEEARGSMNGAGPEAVVTVDRLGVSDVLKAIVEAPYPALKVLIPDLVEEDVKGASLPNLKFVLQLLIEVNGVEWFEKFLKNSIGPLLPKIIEKAVEAISEDVST